MISLGIDIGTTSICGVLLDAEDGTVLQAETIANNSFIRKCEPYEKMQEPTQIMAVVDTILDRLFSPSVGCIGLTGQMHGIVYTDADGNAVSPLYTWQDGRGNLTDGDGVSYARRLGGASGFGLVTDLYNQEHGLVPPNASAICTIHDYAAMRLSGRKTPLMHISDAASLGCFDTEKLCFTMAHPMLPEVTDDFSVVGAYHGIPVTAAIGDNQASFLSAAGGDCVLVNVGTGSQVSVPAAGFLTAPGLETRPLNKNQYILVGSSLCGGRAFALLERFFASVCQMATGKTPASLYPMIDRMLTADGETDLVMDTRFSGTRQDPTLRGSLSQISTENLTACNVARAAINGMTEELYAMYAASGIRCARLAASGNGIRRNAALRRTVEKRFGQPLHIPANREEAAAGAALSALAGTGVYSSMEEISAHIRYE